MNQLQQLIDELSCNAFLGVCHTVDRGTALSWHLLDDEERMQPIDALIEELEELNTSNKDLLVLKTLEQKGITEVVLIRGW